MRTSRRWMPRPTDYARSAGQPSIPRDEWTCDFCGDPANAYQEMRRGRSNLQTAQYIFACPRHIDAARKAANPKAE